VLGSVSSVGGKFIIELTESNGYIGSKRES